MNVNEIFGENIRRLRRQMNMTQKQFGAKVGMSESQIWAWENNKTDPPMSALSRVADALDIRETELISRHAPKKHDSGEKYDFSIRIYNQDDRMEVISILAKNGYDVGQHKKRRTETGKTVDYYVHAKLLEDNADTSK